MIPKTGKRETTSLLIIYSLTPVLIALVGIETKFLASGALINHAICFLLALLMLRIIKFYFSVWGNRSLLCISDDVLGKSGTIVIGVVFFLLLLISSSSGLRLASSQISSLSFGNISESNIRLTIAISSLVLAYLGLEALTRHSYVILFLGYVIIGGIIYASINGWQRESLFPIFGSDVRKTFTCYVSISIFSLVVPLLFISRCQNNKNDAYHCIRKALVISFVIAFVLILVYILTVPYPIGKLYTHSLEAIFSSGSSGDILYRFEIFLLVVLTMFSVIANSFSLIVCGAIFEKLCNFSDHRPLVLVIGVMVGSISSFGWTAKEYVFSYLFLAFLSFFLPLIFSLWGRFIKWR